MANNVGTTKRVLRRILSALGYCPHPARYWVFAAGISTEVCARCGAARYHDEIEGPSPWISAAALRRAAKKDTDAANIRG